MYKLINCSHARVAKRPVHTRVKRMCPHITTYVSLHICVARGIRV
jgi:hypothetical protein